MLGDHPDLFPAFNLRHQCPHADRQQDQFNANHLGAFKFLFEMFCPAAIGMGNDEIDRGMAACFVQNPHVGDIFQHAAHSALQQFPRAFMSPHYAYFNQVQMKPSPDQFCSFLNILNFQPGRSNDQALADRFIFDRSNLSLRNHKIDARIPGTTAAVFHCENPCSLHKICFHISDKRPKTL
jgi:hypothetical protein